VLRHEVAVLRRPTQDHAWSGRPSGPRRADPAASDEATRPPPGTAAPSCAGTSVSYGRSGPTRTGPDDTDQRALASLLARWPGKTRAGLPQNPGRACSNSATTSAPRRSAGSCPPHDPTGTVSTDRHQLAAVPAYAGRQHLAVDFFPSTARLRCGGSTFVRARGRTRYLHVLGVTAHNPTGPGPTKGPQPRHGPREHTAQFRFLVRDRAATVHGVVRRGVADTASR